MKSFIEMFTSGGGGSYDYPIHVPMGNALMGNFIDRSIGPYGHPRNREGYSWTTRLTHGLFNHVSKGENDELLAQ